MSKLKLVKKYSHSPLVKITYLEKFGDLDKTGLMKTKITSSKPGLSYTGWAKT